MLIAYNGQSITYDAQGNPISYLGHTLTWGKGRQLKYFVKEDGTTINYTYDTNGIRTSKTINEITHNYILQGSKILCETWGENEMFPLYDNENSVCGILYNNTPYYFLKNLQGDVLSITDADGIVIANYTYDACGKLICITGSEIGIAAINPFRYRGYYYDEETKLYYLNSRYYDPETGRFLNADESLFMVSHSIPNEHNGYTYGYNSAVNYIDTNGYDALFVVEHGGYGLPVLGHAILCFEDYKEHGGIRNSIRVDMLKTKTQS